jgi:hypothetical protein
MFTEREKALMRILLRQIQDKLQPAKRGFIAKPFFFMIQPNVELLDTILYKLQEEKDNENNNPNK